MVLFNPYGEANAMNGLAQFFTKPDWARACVQFLEEMLPSFFVAERPPLGRCLFVEPSAGNGDFLKNLPVERTVAMDIAPAKESLMQRDFLLWSSGFRPPRGRLVVVGNPPFGRRSTTAVRFFNAAASFAHVVAFVVPVSFRKHRIHKHLEPSFKWVASLSLPRTSFYTLRNDVERDYEVNTEFQVWTSLATGLRDMRLLHPPKTTHEDFFMHQYNNTPAALKVFERPFDFAVPSQGWQDYTRRETNPKNCERQKHWMLFKANSTTVLRRLRSGIDYAELALRNTTSTPGFRKNDEVRAYGSLYDSA